MMRRIFLAAGLTISLVAPAIADGVIVYPSKGQSAEQQEKDKGACMGWASEQTGFNPTAPLPASAPPPEQQPTTSAGKGLLRGALLGLAVGAIAGDAGAGAAIGAGTGLLVGGTRNRAQQNQNAAQQDAWAQQQADKYAQSQSAFNRAYGTCMQGRGYAVNQS